MSKRRTREQKIIAELRRKLAQTQNSPTNIKYQSPVEKKIVYQEEKIPAPKILLKPNQTLSFAYDPKLIKKDLIKTLILSLIFLSSIFIIRQLFHL